MPRDCWKVALRKKLRREAEKEKNLKNRSRRSREGRPGERVVDSPIYKAIEKLCLPFFKQALREHKGRVKFKSEKEMFSSWLLMENPLLGGIAPMDMLLMGRGEKLLKVVRIQLEGNRRG